MSTIKAKEKSFTDELEIYREETHAAAQFFFSWLTITKSLDDSNIRARINRSPLFWRTALGALLSSFIISLGRIFDSNSKHNVYRLLKIAKENIVIFSREALAERKRDALRNESELQYYLDRVHYPDVKDIRSLSEDVARRFKTYNSNYKDIRHKIFAHREKSTFEEMQALYRNTNINELEEIFIFLCRLHDALWELYHNGRKPDTRKRSSLLVETDDTMTKELHQRITIETEKLLKTL